MENLSKLHLNVRHCRYMHDLTGMEWGPRTIPDYELIMIVSGKYLYIDNTGQLQLQPGDFLFIEPLTTHVFRNISDEQNGIHICAHFDLVDNSGKTFYMHQSGFTPQSKTRISDFDHVHKIFAKASEDFTSYSRFHREIVNSAVRQIFLTVAEKWFETKRLAVSKMVDEMMEYLRTNMIRPISRMDLARQFNYTPEHINYLFKKELGISPTRFLNRERAIKGFKLLYEEGLSVQQAASKTGFSSQYYFSRVFKDIFGYPPSKIKKYITGDIEDIFEKHISTD
jgi:AraC-like DNA-binding protein